jgi:hypothetical protein
LWRCSLPSCSRSTVESTVDGADADGGEDRSTATLAVVLCYVSDRSGWSAALPRANDLTAHPQRNPCRTAAGPESS